MMRGSSYYSGYHTYARAFTPLPRQQLPLQDFERSAFTTNARGSTQRPIPRRLDAAQQPQGWWARSVATFNAVFVPTPTPFFPPDAPQDRSGQCTRDASRRLSSRAKTALSRPSEQDSYNRIALQRLKGAVAFLETVDDNAPLEADISPAEQAELQDKLDGIVTGDETSADDMEQVQHLTGRLIAHRAVRDSIQPLDDIRQHFQHALEQMHDQPRTEQIAIVYNVGLTNEFWNERTPIDMGYRLLSMCHAYAKEEAPSPA